MNSLFRVVAWSEVLRLRRSPLRSLALLLYLAVGVASIEIGRGHLETLRSSLEEGERRQESLRAEAFGWFEEGRVGPEDRPWVDITEPLWMDWYSGSHLGLEAEALAGLSVGVSDVRGNLVRLNRLATPFDADQWRQLANPEMQLLGVMDLSFVLSLLMPLLVIVLVFDLRSYERDRGIEGLVVLQAGQLRTWFWSRLLIAGALAGLPTLVLWILGGWRTEAIVSQPTAWLLGGLLTLSYLAVWVGFGGAVAARSGSANRAALVLASAWICFSVLLPAAANQVVNSAEPVGYSTQIIDAVRADRYKLYEQPVEALLPSVYEEFPALSLQPYAEAEEREDVRDRHVFDLASLQLTQEAYDRVAASERRRLETAGRFVLANPVQAFQAGLNQLAGTEALAYVRFGQAILDSVQIKVGQILELAWTLEPSGRDEFVGFADSVPKRFNGSRAPAATVWAALLLWGLASLVLASGVKEQR
ncbi:MAG: hypothetical protein AAF690_20205 [Acidobacteriota bacterium]